MFPFVKELFELAREWLEWQKAMIEVTDPVSKKPLIIRRCEVSMVMPATFEHRPARTIIELRGRMHAIVAFEGYHEVKGKLGLPVTARDHVPQEHENGLILVPDPVSPRSN